MSRIAFIAFIILFTSFTGRAQDNKFDFGIGLFPNFSKGLISNDGTVEDFHEDIFREEETWNPSISANLFAEYKLSEKSSLGLGLGYQNTGSRTKVSDIYYGDNSPAPPLPTQTRTVYTQHNIEIPLYYKHRFGKRFFALIGTSGIINVSNTSSSVVQYSDSKIERNTNQDNSTEFRNFNVSGNFGFGLDFIQKEKISCFALPYAQYGILGISKTATLNRNMLSIGVLTGIRL